MLTPRLPISMGFDEVLEQHKENFEAHRAMLVLDDMALRRFVLCWQPNLVRRVSDWPTGYALSDLWDCVQVDIKALMDLTAYAEPQARAALRQVQGLGFVYPDGTVPAEVVALLNKRLRALRTD